MLEKASHAEKICRELLGADIFDALAKADREQLRCTSDNVLSVDTLKRDFSLASAGVSTALVIDENQSNCSEGIVNNA